MRWTRLEAEQALQALSHFTLLGDWREEVHFFGGYREALAARKAVVKIGRFLWELKNPMPKRCESEWDRRAGRK